MNFKVFSLTVITASILLSGCANTKIANINTLDQEAKEMASSATMSPQQAMVSAAGKINKASEDELGFYAPLHFKAANAALSDSQNALKKSDGQNALEKKTQEQLALQEAFKVESLLKKGYENKQKVQKTLSLALEHKAVLEELSVPTILPDDYQDVVENLQDLIKDIEGNFMDKAVAGQADVLAAMEEVEIDTMKKIHLTAAESMLDKAESADANEFAEKTFEKAEAALEHASRYVEKNYRDRDGVKNIGLEALNAASHAYFIGLEAEQLVKINAEQAEQKVLYFESLLDRVNQPLGVVSLNTMSMYDQSVILSGQVEKLLKQLGDKMPQVVQAIEQRVEQGVDKSEGTEVDEKLVDSIDKENDKEL